MVELKTLGEIEAMAAAGAGVARALAAVQELARAGTRLDALDQVARQVLHDAGADSPFLGYHPSFGASPFPGVVCLSVNDAVLHGPPTACRLREADLLSVDCGATLDGWTGDAATSFCVGSTSSTVAHLLKHTRAARAAGIAAARPGARLGDISAAIGAIARAAGLGLHTDFGGHGIGRMMHESAPHVPNNGRPGRGMQLRPGLTIAIAIEPWFLAGGLDAYRIDEDGWTIRSTDGSRGAHFEHTIAVTESGPRVLTAPNPTAAADPRAMSPCRG